MMEIIIRGIIICTIVYMLQKKPIDININTHKKFEEIKPKHEIPADVDEEQKEIVDGMNKAIEYAQEFFAGGEVDD